MAGPNRTEAHRGRRTAAVALLLAALGAVLLAAPRGERASAQAPQRPPNIVVVMTDDQTVEQMGALPRVRGLLVRQGTSFASSFSSFPLCCPSRATYLTGPYAHNNGGWATRRASRAATGG